nr:MAG TPA: hypothetical protein [Caudoviricetes sp.]
MITDKAGGLFQRVHIVTVIAPRHIATLFAERSQVVDTEIFCRFFVFTFCLRIICRETFYVYFTRTSLIHRVGKINIEVNINIFRVHIFHLIRYLYWNDFKFPGASEESNKFFTFLDRHFVTIIQAVTFPILTSCHPYIETIFCMVLPLCLLSCVSVVAISLASVILTFGYMERFSHLFDKNIHKFFHVAFHFNKNFLCVFCGSHSVLPCSKLCHFVDSPSFE